MTYDWILLVYYQLLIYQTKVVFIDRNGADELDISRFKNYGT